MDRLSKGMNGPFPLPSQKQLQTACLDVQREGRIQKRGREIPIPLSPAQRRIWILQQLEPESPIFNRPMAVRLKGYLDQRVLEISLSEIVKRHESLRTVFADQNGEPIQLVLSSLPLSLETRDLQNLPQEEREQAAQRIAATETQKPFNLAKGPLIRSALLQLSQDDHVLLILMHHIVFDGWSEGILMKELGILYEAGCNEKTSPLPDIPIQYADFAIWQQERLSGEFLNEQLEYWKRHLNGLPSMLTLPTDYPRTNVRALRGARSFFSLPSSLAAQLKDFSRHERVTIFMTLLSAFQLLLCRYTGQEDLSVGVPVAGRTRAEIEGLIGCLMNVIVLRTNLDGNPSFRELIARVRKVALQAYKYQDVPFERLVEELKPERHLSRWPLFQVMFNLRNMPQVEQAKATALRMEPFAFDSEIIGGLDLSLEIKESKNGLDCSFCYSTDLFNGETIQRMGQHFQVLLEAGLKSPDHPVLSLPLFTAEERQQLVITWNDTQRDYPTKPCIHELFELQVERTPDAVAVVFEDEQLTYQELNERSNQLAHYLRKLGVGPEVLVGICIERSLEMVVGLLGILKSGGAYVPLDPSYPQEHLGFMLDDARPFVLLTQERLLGKLPRHETHIVCLDSEWGVIAREDARTSDSRVASGNLAYVIYTSGSTGRPKGVMISHRAVCNHLYWRHEYFPLTEADRLLQKASFSFDDSVWEFFEPLMVGATLFMARSEKLRDSADLVKLISKYRITSLCLVPSMLKVFLAEPNLDTCGSLKRITTGGETLAPEIQHDLFDKLSAGLHNGYGPTETTISATFWTCKSDDQSGIVPIGRPIANTQIYLLDSYFQPVPIGVTGEIYIGGIGLSRGYLHRSELTAERFLPNPFGFEPGARLYRTGDLGRYLPDGNIEFLGRSDQQVKIRGFRIELGEIEAALSQHPKVQAAAVVVCEDIPGDKRLMAYVAGPKKSELSAGDLRGFLKKKLPTHMVPSSFAILDSLPLLPSGKVDRHALPKPGRAQQEMEVHFVPPHTPIEEALADIWAEVLDLERVGIHDNFFDLGGHSLLGTKVMSRVRNEFQVSLFLRTLFEAPTVAELAMTVIHRLVEEERPLGMIGVTEGSKTPSIQEGMK